MPLWFSEFTNIYGETNKCLIQIASKKGTYNEMQKQQSVKNQC